MPKTSKITARLAAKNLQQQVQFSRQADSLGLATDAAVGKAWKIILQILRHYHGPLAWVHSHRTEAAVRDVFADLFSRLHSIFDKSLVATAQQSRERVTDDMADHLPLPTMLTESLMREDDTLPPGELPPPPPLPPPIRPGFVRLFVSPIRTLATRHLAAPLRNPAISKAAKKELAKQLIFPPPPLAQVRKVVYRGDWFARLQANTKLAAPEDVAKVIRMGFTAGKSMRDIARDLVPVLNGVRSSARRVARNEVSRIAHDMQWDAWQEVKDLIVGYQVHAVDNGHSPTSRPEHRARHGTIYYKNPKGGQKGMAECPRPPHEADGSLAHNCRCWITPVFGPMPALPKDDSPHPIDAEIAAPWFAAASVRDRKAAVGADRYNLVRQSLNRQPSWFDFIDQATGDFLGMDQLTLRLASKV